MGEKMTKTSPLDEGTAGSVKEKRGLRFAGLTLSGDVLSETTFV